MSHARRVRAAVMAACLLVLVSSVPAYAQQLSLVGPTTDTIPGYPIARGTDTAFDPFNRVYLQISAQGPVTGMFTSEAGAPVSGQIQITTGATAFASYPRVIYSPDVFGGAGGFLVTWHQNDGVANSNVVHGRLLQFGATPVLGADTVLAVVPTGTWWEAAPAVVYSRTSQHFLVVFQAYAVFEVHAVRVGLNGAPMAAPFKVSPTGEGGRDPSVVWNPIANEFGVSFSGWNATSAVVTFARVNMTGTDTATSVIRTNPIFAAAGSFITDIAFNPFTNTYAVAYFVGVTRVTEVDSAGDVVMHPLLFTPVGTYDGLSLAYNPISGSHLLVGQYTYEVGGLELDGHGAKISLEQEVTATGATSGGAFYPRVTSSIAVKNWQISFSRSFVIAAVQIVATTSQVGPPPADTDLDGVYDLIDGCPLAFFQTVNGCPAIGAQLGDVSNDGKPDVVFQHMPTGQLYSWWMANGVLVGQSVFTPAFGPGVDWLVVSKDDFTGDGLVDFLWQNQVTGDILLWPMQGTTLINNTPVSIPIAPGPWRIVATPDINRDGHPDIVWQKVGTGEIYLWVVTWTSAGQPVYLGGGTLIDSFFFPISGPGTDWVVVTAGDVNEDGRPDLVLQQQTGTKAVVTWYLGGTQGNVVLSVVSIAPAAGPWRVRMLNDMNSDGHLDIVWQDAVTPNRVYGWYLNGAGVPLGDSWIQTGLLPPTWRVVGGK